MTPIFVYDDTPAVPPEIDALVGVPRFGSLLHRRRRLREHVESAAIGAGFSERAVLTDLADRSALADAAERAPLDTRYVYLTSDIVGEQADFLENFIGKLAYAERDTVAFPERSPPGSCVASLSARSLVRLLRSDSPRQRLAFFTERREEIEEIPAGWLRGLSDPDVFVRFLSGGFYTRAFNAIRQRGSTIRKESSDAAKMRAEHDFWYLLPPELQRFVVQPFGFSEDGGLASYSMERFNVPDLAVLWVHGPEAVPPDAFEVLLDRAFEWLEARPKKAVPPAEARAVAEELYVGKLDRRVEQLLAGPPGLALDRILEAGTGSGLRAIVGRYKRLLAEEWKDGPGATLAVTHGDLCLSNVLYDKRTRLLKFIDPKGARKADDLWSDPYYDAAKLSHSILGGYDLINHELFEVALDDRLRLELRTDRAPVHGERFRARLRAAGFEERRLRLYEASLFLSMLPLHQEAPLKLVGFTLTAIRILDELEGVAKPSWIARLLGRR